MKQFILNAALTFALIFVISVVILDAVIGYVSLVYTPVRLTNPLAHVH